jgi:hypothetical protein
MYTINLDNKQLKIVTTAASLYAKTFCGHVEAITNVLRSECKYLDLSTEAELIKNIKLSLTPELELNDFYDIEDTRVTALTKMVHDIHATITKKIEWEESDSAFPYKPLQPTSADQVPEFHKIVDTIKGTYYQLILSERLYLALSKALHLYESILIGDIHMLYPISIINGCKEVNKLDLQKALYKFAQAYFDGEIQDSIKAKIANKLRMSIEYEHPELRAQLKAA